MKSIHRLINLILGIMLILLAWVTWHPQASTDAHSLDLVGETCNTSRTVQASGTAVVNVAPDRALLQLGVQSNGATPDVVQSANSQAIQRVIRAVYALGVETKDIATDYLIIYPVYEDFNSMVIKGYRIDNTVSITLRDVNLADDTILAALKAGANEVQDVQFYTSELRKYRDQARTLAMKAAGEKAQSLAEAANAQTGCVISVSENTWSHYYGSWRGGREAGLWTQNAVQNVNPSQGAPETSEDSPISLGQIAVQAQVTASFSLK